MRIINALFLLFLFIVIGIISRKFSILPKDSKKTLSAFIYYFALPAIFFQKISQFDFFNLDVFLVLGSLIPVTVILFILIGLRFFNLIPRDVFFLSAIPVTFGSYTFFGFPFFISLYGEEILTTSVFTASVLGIYGILVTVLLFELAVGKKVGKGIFINILKNPLVLSIMLGLIFSFIPVKLTYLDEPLTVLGQSAKSIAIVALGMFIYDNFSRDVLKKAYKFSLIRVISFPVVTFLVILLFPGVSPDLKSFIFIQSGIPTAISTAILAQRYEYKTGEFSGIVIVTSLFSLLTLPALFLGGRFLW